MLLAHRITAARSGHGPSSPIVRETWEQKGSYIWALVGLEVDQLRGLVDPYPSVPFPYHWNSALGIYRAAAISLGRLQRRQQDRFRPFGSGREIA